MPKILICKSKMPDKTKGRSKRQMANSDKSKIRHENSYASKGHLQLETHTRTHTHNCSTALCPGYPGGVVPEETFNRSHS